MAGMFYLPRIFVYHSENSLNDETYQKFLIMERKLIRIIMTPAMLSTWLFGILLCLYNTNYLTELWLIVKIFVVIKIS
jgi:putative membrane protein